MRKPSRNSKLKGLLFPVRQVGCLIAETVVNGARKLRRKLAH